jgi:tetratricopeptide (TPR) repeat protein
VTASPAPRRVVHTLMLATLLPATGLLVSADAVATVPNRPIVSQSAEDGPDLTRRADEDARIAAAEDVIARCEARLDAAATAIRLDLPPRIRTRIWWTPVSPDLAARATEAAGRARALADASFTELLTTSHPAVERLQAQAAVTRAMANALSNRVDADSSKPWRETLATFRTEASDGPDRTSALDGPTLLLLAAGALASDDRGVDDARAFLERAGTVPDGIDATEYKLVEALIEAEGLDAARRRSATANLLKSPQPAPDRLLLGAIHLDAVVESGRSPSDAIDETLRAMLPTRGVDAADRVRVVRAFAQLADATVPATAATGDMPAIVALARLAPIVEKADPKALSTGPARALIERAATSTSPDVRAEVWLDAATIRMRGGDADGALDAILNALEAAPRHPKGEMAAGLAMRLAERIEDELVFDASVGRLLAAQPDHPQRHRWSLLRGDRALASGDTASARTAWSGIPATADVGVEAGLRLLALDADRLDTTSAAGMLETLDALEPRVPEARSDRRRVDADLLRIQALLVLERTTTAADIAARFLDVAQVPADARLAVAQTALPALEAADRTADADRMRAALATLDPTLATRAVGDQLHRDFESVMDAIDRDDRAAARKTAASALDRVQVDVAAMIREAPTRTKAAIELGWMLAAAGRFDEASRISDAVVAAHPGGLEGLFLQATLQGARLESIDRSRVTPSEERAAAAIRTLSRINAGSGRGSPWWWRSEIEKLEILAALGRDLPKIDARLQRLETEFQDLGGQNFERRARSLRASIQSRRIRE